MTTATTYAAKCSARDYVEHYAAFTGDLKRPGLTVHTTVDPINSPFHERLYAETMNAAGKSDHLHQLYGARPPDEFFAPAGGFDFIYAPSQPYYRPSATTGELGWATPAGIAAGTPIYLPLAIK